MKKIYNILLLFTALFAYGQVNLVVETEKKARDYSDIDDVVVNVLLEVIGKDMIQQTPLRMFDTSRFEVIASGSEQNTYVDAKTGFRVNRTLYQYVLRPKKAGRLKIGSASVIVNEKLYYTEPFDIFVVETDKKVIVDKNFDDVYLNVELEDREVYKNQPTVAVLRAYSRNFDSFRKVKNIKLPTQDNISIRQVSYEKSEIEPAGEMASQILAVFLIYPEEAGRIEVAPASASVSPTKYKIVSNKVKLKVKNLPRNAPSDFKNAVGSFTLDLIDRSEHAEVEKPMNISLTLSGEGNFSNMALPKIKESADYTIYTPNISKNINSSKTGEKGKITANYVIVARKAGPISIATESFSYFDPELNRYVNLGEKSIIVNAFTHQEILAARTPMERVNEYTNTFLETVDNPVIETKNLKIQKKSAINWSTLWINSGVLLAAFLGFLLFKYLRKKNQTTGNAKIEKDLGSVADTENMIRAELKTDVNAYFVFLGTLKDNGDYDKFFTTLEELDREVQKQYGANSSVELRSGLEKLQGTKTAEEYRSLRHKIELERYAPVHTQEYISELLEDAVNLYSQIAK